MDPIKQVRKSCETCRTRKLRCSGDKTGCTRCKALSIPCRFKNKGLPGRPRKRLRPEPERRERTLSSSSHFSSIPDLPLSDDAILLDAELDSFHCGIAGSCGFDALPRMENGCFPELWQMGHGRPEPGLVPSGMPDLTPMDYRTVVCKCDEEVSGLARSLNRVDMGHNIISTLRIGVSLAERLLTCPVCYDVSKPPRVTVQNVLLIGHLMLEVTSGYTRYLKWLNRDAEGEGERESETVYLDSGLGFPSELNLQISGEKFRDLVVHGLQADVERLVMLGENFADRQRRRHTVGHEGCSDAERCRRLEYGVDHDPLDVCPHNPVARKLIPCFRIVDEVQEMIRQVAGALV